MVPKLKYEHIHLNSFSKMGVDLAAQVYNVIYNLYSVILLFVVILCKKIIIMIY